MITVSDGDSGRIVEIDASTAEILLPTVWNVFGPGIVKKFNGAIITIQSGNLEGHYTWSSNASQFGELYHTGNAQFPNTGGVTSSMQCLPHHIYPHALRYR